jgi:membrane peptidoglycan carboxypeptidase
MVSRGNADPADRPDRKPGGTGDSLFTRIRTGEWPVVKIDLSEAYANVRRRATTLRRRRIISAVMAAVVFAGLATVLGVYYVSAIPLPDQLAMPVTTTVYYSDGTTVMARLGSQRRTIVPASTLPPYVPEAVVAAEDPAYWLGSGTLISRQYARAANAVRGGGGSDSPAAQARLLVMSWKLEDTYSKDEILEFYLNTVYFGRGSYGIEAAAQSYFGIRAANLSVAQAILLAGVIESPGDGRFDPSVNFTSASAKFAAVAQRMVSLGSIDQLTASRLVMPRVHRYDPARFASALDEPTGLVVTQVLAELRDTDPFRDKAPGYLEDGGFAIVTTVDARAQALLEETIDGTVPSSLMAGQPRNLQAAAVVVEPGTGRVLAYFGGSDGAGADYAGTYRTPDGEIAGFGAHPPAQTFGAFVLAAALENDISVESRWDAPSVREYPASGRDVTNPVRDVIESPCQPACSLIEATTASLTIPFYSVTERVGAAAVIDQARAAGIDAMWTPGSAAGPGQRYGLTGPSATELTPEPFGSDVALGVYPVTVLNQANAMATFAAGGRRGTAHFVERVGKDFSTVYSARPGSSAALSRATVADLTWVLSQNPAGQLSDDRPSASLSGSARLGASALDMAHAWQVGYTGNLAMAVWVGNRDSELPLRDKLGNRIIGTGLPAEIYRTFLGPVHGRLGLPAVEFPEPVFHGDATAGDAR